MLDKQNVSEQVASHLREELMRHRWTDRMPGRDKLAKELGVHGSTIERALQQLETEGLVKSLGPGKPRQIIESHRLPAATTSVCILPYEAGDMRDEYILALQHHLSEAGHEYTFPPQTMRDLKFDPERIATMVKKQTADAWIVYSGSRQILEKFTQLSLPTFALFGRMNGLPIAGSGTDILSALRETIGCLYDYGHRRIVMLTRAQLIESGLGLTERTFIEELDKRKLPHGSYNLVAIDNTPASLRLCLEKLFQVTPPSAILVDDWMIYNAVQNFLIRERGVAFRKVSCISMDYHPSFAWYQPEAPHFYWDPAAVVRCAMKWVNDIGRRKIGIQQKQIKAEFRGREALVAVE